MIVIHLGKDDVMRIVCKHFDLEVVEKTGGGVVPIDSKIFWKPNYDNAEQQAMQRDETEGKSIID